MNILPHKKIIYSKFDLDNILTGLGNSKQNLESYSLLFQFRKI